jgi:hypothetical protein
LLQNIDGTTFFLVGKSQDFGSKVSTKTLPRAAQCLRDERMSKDFEQRLNKSKDSEQRLKKSKDLNS